MAQQKVDDCDICSTGAYNSDGEQNETDAAVLVVIQQNVYDCDMPSTAAHLYDDGQNEAIGAVSYVAQQNMEVEAPSLELRTVSLIQAVKIPARYQKLVRVQMTNNSFEQQQLILSHY